MYPIQYYGQLVHGQLSEDFDGDHYEELLQAALDEEAEEYFDSCLTPILDEYGEVIPLSKCICGAHTPFECGCACDSWGNLEDYDDC